MRLDYHIISVCKSTYFHLRNIGGFRNIISNDACSQLIHSLVTVCLDYCNSILYGLPDNSVSFTENSKHCCKNFGSFTKLFTCFGYIVWLALVH